jgi:hypothetical protein
LLFCMSLLHVSAPCCMPCFMSMLHVCAAGSCCIDLLHVHAACQCYMSMVMSLLHACSCCMSMLNVNTACPCCKSFLHVLAASHFCMSLLHCFSTIFVYQFIFAISVSTGSDCKDQDRSLHQVRNILPAYIGTFTGSIFFTAKNWVPIHIILC